VIIVAFALCGLTAAISSRLVDPMITVIARDMVLPVTTAALLSSAYSLPFALAQPLLGPLADSWGRSRLLKICLAVVATCATLCALAPTFELLVTARLVAGIAAGGIVPSSMAMIGDRFSGDERQIMVGRFVSIALIGQVLSAGLAGMVADHVSWRIPLLAAAIIAFATALFATRTITEARRTPVRKPGISAALTGYRLVFSNPKAYLCYGTVFLEGVAFFGSTPYIADLLERTGRGGPTEAGLVLGCFGIGGIVFSLSLPWLLPRLSRTILMSAGGCIAGAGLAGLASPLSWPWIALLFVISGIGFMMLHNSIQTETLDIAPAARSSCYAAHAFSFFMGQSLGPVTFGALLDGAEAAAALVFAMVTLAVAGVVAAFLFARLEERQLRAT
jgi:predicted MFS family arabinose efflux permease